jgi:hypothetical protein
MGEYHFKGAGDGSPNVANQANHNIMLEYCQQDLDEYLYEAYPPVLTTEIIAFWEDIFQLADTIQNLHHLEYKAGDGTPHVNRTQSLIGFCLSSKTKCFLRIRRRE